jgi:hypothetical protein
VVKFWSSSGESSGTTGIALEAAAPEERVAMTSALIITALFGLSIPVVGTGVALSEDFSAANTVLGFGTAVALGVALSDRRSRACVVVVVSLATTVLAGQTGSADRIY